MLEFFIPGIAISAIGLSAVYLFTKRGSRARTWVTGTPNRIAGFGIAIFVLLLASVAIYNESTRTISRPPKRFGNAERCLRSPAHPRVLTSGIKAKRIPTSALGGGFRPLVTIFEFFGLARCYAERHQTGFGQKRSLNTRVTNIKFKQYDVVRLMAIYRPAFELDDGFNLRRPAIGDVATIVEIYSTPPGYELECSDQNGITQLLMDLIYITMKSLYEKTDVDTSFRTLFDRH
jgi:hypothetical protein